MSSYASLFVSHSKIQWVFQHKHHTHPRIVRTASIHYLAYHSTNSLSIPQWSTWAKSANTLWRHYAQISEALHNISNDADEKQETDAHPLNASPGILNVAFITYLTGSRLHFFNYRQLTFVLFTAAFLLSSLWECVMANTLKPLKGKPQMC